MSTLGPHYACLSKVHTLSRPLMDSHEGALQGGWNVRLFLGSRWCRTCRRQTCALERMLACQSQPADF